MKRVNIILSTYNGERYLKEQLKSLIEQTYSNIVIYIRDDGSSDSTVEIIKNFQEIYGQEKIVFLEDTDGNVGYVKSFLKIIRSCKDADYYAFCDQDDYWLPNKIERAVKFLDSQVANKCLLYTSAYAVCDGNLNVIGCGHKPTELEKLSVGKALSLYDGGWLLGFTCVINDYLKRKAFDNTVIQMYSHDIWIQTVTVAFKGILYYDEEVTAYFRRHINTTSVAETGMARSVIKAWKYRWNEVFGNGDMFKRIKSGIVSFNYMFSDRMVEKEDIIFLRTFAESKPGFMTKMKKVFYPFRLKEKILVEIAWRCAILLGRI